MSTTATQASASSSDESPNSRIKSYPQNFNELIEISREDVTQIWHDEKLCLKYLGWMEKACKSSKNPRPFIRHMEYYVDECLAELNDIDTPCYQEENYGKAGDQPPMSAQSSSMIYDVLPRLAESFAYMRPPKDCEFAINHLFRTVLILCKRCIELDIECFRLLEIVFGFLGRDAQTKFTFYGSCGRPKSSGYRRSDYSWYAADYGNGEMSVFMRMQELERLKKDAKQKLDALIAKTQEMEEYEEELPVDDADADADADADDVDNNADNDKTDNTAADAADSADAAANNNNKEETPTENDALKATDTTDTNANGNASTSTDAEAEAEPGADVEQKTDDNKAEDDAATKPNKDDNESNDANHESEQQPLTASTAQDSPDTGPGADNQETATEQPTQQKKKTVTIKKTRAKQLSAEELELRTKLESALRSYDEEFARCMKRSEQFWEISDFADYPTDYIFSGGANELSRDESWFRVQNINYWGRIGGFSTILKRIEHAKCAVPVSDLVNLIRPIAQLRELLNRDYFEDFVTKLRAALKIYYRDLPDLVVRELSKSTVEKSLKNLHFMMNNHYGIEQINEAKEKLKLQIAGRQFRAPYAQSRIFGMNDINRYIKLAIEKHELQKSSSKRWNFNQSQEQKQREQLVLNLWLDIKFIQRWIEEEGVLEFCLNRQTTHLELVKRLGPIWQLLKYNNAIDIKRHIDPLWQLTLGGQHEAIKFQVYELISDLSESLSLEQTKHLFQQIAKTPKQEYDSQMLQLIRKITIQAFMKQEAWDKKHNIVHDEDRDPAAAGAGAAAGGGGAAGPAAVSNGNNKNEKPATDLQPKNASANAASGGGGGGSKKSWFGLDLLWKFVQSADAAESSSSTLGGMQKKVRRVIDEKTAREALQIFLELLSKDYAISQRKAYQEKCIWHIQQSSKVVQNLQLLQQLIQTHPRTAKTWWGTNTTQNTNTQAGVIERLERDYAIIDHLLQDLALYKTTVASIIDDDKAAAAAEAKAAMHNGNRSANGSKSLSPRAGGRLKSRSIVQTLRVDDSSFGYLEQIKIRQDFLLFLLTHSGLRLTRAQYRSIWDHLVSGALCREEMDLCYFWLLRGSIPPHFSSTNDSHYRLYNQTDQKYLFEHCLLRLPPAQLSDTGYLLVVSFFCSVNKRAGAVSIKGEKRQLPRRAGDGQGIQPVKNQSLKSKISSTLSPNGSAAASAVNGAAASASSLPSTSGASSTDGGGGGGDDDDDDDDRSKSPTRKTRDHLEKFVKHINSDLLNEDGTYLIDPDDHYISAKRLRVIDYTGLEGIGYFWQIVLKAVLPSVGLQAIELLNAMHFYFAPRIKPQERDKIRQEHVNKCLGFLEQALAADPTRDKNRIVVKRMIMLLKQFLESFVKQVEGVNHDNLIEVEIQPDKEFRTKHYVAVCKLTETFGALRRKILNHLLALNSGLIVDHLIIQWNVKYTITQHEHDAVKLSKLDWSKSRVLVIKRVRYAFTRNFWKVPASQQPISDAYPYPIESSLPVPPHQQLMSGFKRVNALQMFSQDDSIYAKLFPLTEQAQIGPAVWDILNLLPPSFTRVRRIIELGAKPRFEGNVWDTLFDLNRPYQLLYQLQILCSVLSGEEWKKEYFSTRVRNHTSHLEWIQNFINLGGFSFVTKLLFEIDVSLKSRPNRKDDEQKLRRINVNCLAYSFQIVSLLLSMDKTFKSVISSEKNVRDGSITKVKDFPYIEKKLIQTALNISQKILLWSDVAARQREEEEEKRQQHQRNDSNDFMFDDQGSSGVNGGSGGHHGVDESSDDIHSHLKIRRQVSDFSNLTDVTDLGPNGATILVECLQIMIGCMRTNPKYVDALFEMEHLTQWLTSLLLNTQYPETRPAVSGALQMLSRVQTARADDDKEDATKAGPIKLLNELMKIFQSSRSQTQNCREFFELLLHVFDHVCRVYKHCDSVVLLKCTSIARQAFMALKRYASLEKYQEPETVDQYLVGILNLIRISAHHQLYDAHSDDDDDTMLKLCEYVFYDCLFNVPQQNDYGAKCKAAQSRRIAYALLHKLNEKYPDSLSLLESIILRDPIWFHVGKQSLKDESWHYHPSDLERFPVRYVGLKNQGATCYMNSLVQQMFLVDDFRRQILSARVQNADDAAAADNNDASSPPPPSPPNGADEQFVDGGIMSDDEDDDANVENKRVGLRSKDSVLYQIQLLFGYLMKSQKKFYDTMPLCRVLRGFDGQPLPIGEQQDVNEFCARLFDQLETNLKGTDAEKCIDAAFGGTIMNQMIAQETCQHKSEREEMYHTVSLTVKNKSTLTESLELYVKGDILDGDNKWLCSKCNDKRAALKRSCFGKLSKYLILHLSRFEFDFNTMRRKKLNTRFEFPLRLNMEKYTREGLIRAEREKAAEKAAKVAALKKKNGDADADAATADKDDKTAADAEQKDDDNEPEAEEEEEKEEKKDSDAEEAELPSHPSEYYEFRLVGVVVHTGGAEAGHYYSFAQSSDSKWWEFNDTKVEPFNMADLDKETFGGKHWVSVDDPQQKGKKIRKELDKPFNAYMLIYKQVWAENNQPQNSNFQTFEQEEQALKLPPPIQETIWSENLKFLCDKNVFDFDYLTFLWQTVQLASLRSSAVQTQHDTSQSSSASSQSPSSAKTDDEKYNDEMQLPVSSSSSPAMNAELLASHCDGLQAIQIATCFVFEILVRAKDNGTFPRWMRQLYKMYQQSEIGRKWFLNKVATQQQWFINTMFFNSHKPARLAFGDLLLAILYYQSPLERHSYDEFVRNINSSSSGDAALQSDDNHGNVDVCLQWPPIETNGNSSVRGMGDIIMALHADRFSVARFIVQMFRFLHLCPKYHQKYEEYFQLLKGIANVGWNERKLLIELGVIRSIVAFYLNDTQILHFNRQVVGRSDNGQRQYVRVSPPRSHDLIKLLSMLVRSASTTTFPPSSADAVGAAAAQNSEAEPRAEQLEAADTLDLPDEPSEEEPPDLPEPKDEDDEAADAEKDTTTQTQDAAEKAPTTAANGNIVEEQSVSIKANEETDNKEEKETAKDGDNDNSTNDKAKDKDKEQEQLQQQPRINYFEQEFEEKSVEFGFPPKFVRKVDGKGRGILLSDADKWCLWNGIIQPQLLGLGPSSLVPWDVPKAIDPLPTPSEYSHYIEGVQAVQGYRKKHGGKDAKLPVNLQQVADRIEKQKHSMAAPRKILNMNIVHNLFKDRGGPGNTCLFEAECVEIVVYWCFNNWTFAETIFDWLYRKVAEEFKEAHEYGPFLWCIEHILLTKDEHHQKKIETFIPKMIQLLVRCSDTDDTGTDLLLFQLCAFLIRLSFKNELIASIVKQKKVGDDTLLETIDRNYSSKHQQYGMPRGYGAPNTYARNNGYAGGGGGGGQYRGQQRGIKNFNMRG